MIHPAPPNDDEKKQNLGDVKYVEVDEFLGYVGRFGRFQILLLFLFCCIIIPSTYQTLVMSFVGNNPSWRCVIQPNATAGNVTQKGNTSAEVCGVAGDIKLGDDYYDDRCKMDRSLWTFSKDDDYSIVTQVTNRETDIIYWG